MDGFEIPQGFGTILVAVLVIVLLYYVSMWMIFVKGGESGWVSLVPVYNIVVLARIGDKPEWMGLMVFMAGLIPIIGTMISIGLLFVIWIGVAETFGRGFFFGIGLALLPFIFCPILAFSSERVA